MGGRAGVVGRVLVSLAVAAGAAVGSPASAQVTTSVKGLLRVPPVVAPGETITCEVLDAKRTPPGGQWTIAGQAATEVPRAAPSGTYSITIDLPDDMAPGDPVSARYTSPTGKLVVDAPAIEECRVARPPSVAPQPVITGAAPKAFAGEAVCVCGSFLDETARAGLTVDGRPLGQPVAASGSTVYVRLPADLSPGSHTIAGAASAGFATGAGAAVRALKVRGEIDRNRLRRGQSTPMRLWVDGSDEPLPLRVTNTTPGIVRLEGGNEQTITTSGGAKNGLERTVHAVSPGDFNITYVLALDPCPCAGAIGGAPTTVAVAPTPAPSSPPTTPVETAVIRPRPGDGLRFTVEIHNPSSSPQTASLHDPLPPGCSHVDPGSVSTDGSTTPAANASTETGGVAVTGITVPPGGTVRITYTVYVASGVPHGYTIANVAEAGGTVSNPAGPPPVSNPEQPAGGLDVRKRYDGPAPPLPPRPIPGTTTTGERPGTTTTGGPGTTTTEPVPTPQVPTTTTEPPYQPPGVPTTTRDCDCCCYKSLLWTTGSAINADIVVPGGGGAIDLPLGEQLPLAADGEDSDHLTILCLLTGCTGDRCTPCPPCQAKTMLQLADRLRFHWRIVSGAGMLDTRPHLHSNESLASAAVFIAPDVMPADPNVVVELDVDDSPEKFTDVDDQPVKKRITIKLVPRGGPAPQIALGRLTPSPVITQTSEGKCPCAPFYQFTAGAGIKAELAVPKYVWEKGYAVLWAPGADSDHLQAGCKSGACSSSTPPQEHDLNDPLTFSWKAAPGAILGGTHGEEVVFKPGAVGEATIGVDVQDSGTQYSDPKVQKQDKLTVVGLDPKETGDYIVPHSRANVIRYVIKPAGLVADEVILEVIDKDDKAVRRLSDLPRSNDAVKLYAEYKWDGLTELATALTEKASPYVYRITMVKGEARCRLEIRDRKVKEWDFVFRIPDRAPPVAGGAPPPGVSGIDLKTVVPTLVETYVKPEDGDEVQVPVYAVAEQVVSPADRWARVTLKRSFKGGDNFLVYTSPTAPSTIKYTVTIKSKEGGAIDRAGNEWDLDAAANGVQRTQVWTFVVDADGKLTKFTEQIGN